MSDCVCIRWCGKPVGQPRVRAFRTPAGVRLYTPSTADQMRSGIELMLRAAAEREQWPIGCVDEISVHIEARFARPKSHTRTRRGITTLRDGAPRYPTGKPDADNVAKAVLDAVTASGLIRDDAQVFSLWVQKRWATTDEPQGVALVVRRANH